MSTSGVAKFDRVQRPTDEIGFRGVFLLFPIVKSPGNGEEPEMVVRLAGWMALAAMAVAPVAAQVPAEPPMVRIPGGEYRLGAGAERHAVTLAPFLIDRYEVSNGRFAAFLNTLEIEARRDAPAGRIGPETVSGLDADRVFRSARAFVELDDNDSRIGIRNGQFQPTEGYADNPVPETTWRGARAFCAWRGARLPTEAEWEAAARGREGRIYPWGNEPPTPERAVYGRGSGQTAAVDSHPAGATPEGVHHMAGNLAEWTSTLFRPYPYDAADGREDPDAPGERVTRGGDHVFDVAPDRLTGLFRGGFSRNPRSGHRHIGFRCARDAG